MKHKLSSLVLMSALASTAIADNYLPSISVLNQIQKENVELERIRVDEYNKAKTRSESIVELLRSRVAYINDRNSKCYYRDLSSIDVICINIKLKVRIEKLRSI